MTGLDVPSVVAQDANGTTFDGPVAPDGSFSLKLPVGRTYRLFITDLRASGRQSTESRVLWPGQQMWASVPSGTTQDGAAAIDVGAIRPSGAGGVGAAASPNGSTADGTATGGGGSATGTGGTNGSTTGGTSSSGGGGDDHGGTTDGANGGGSSSGGGGDGSGDHGGSGDSHDGPSLC